MATDNKDRRNAAKANAAKGKKRLAKSCALTLKKPIVFAPMTILQPPVPIRKYPKAKYKD
jgi:hypothetical protein